NWVLYPFWIEHLVDAAFAGAAPALDPVADIKSAVPTEVDIGCQHRPDALVLVGQFEARPFRLDCKRQDAALGPASSLKSAEEEVAAVAVREQANARIIGHAARAGGNMADRRHEKGCLAVEGELPVLLGVPGTQGDGNLHALVTDAPAAVA